MSFVNYPRATASVTVNEPVVIEPASWETVYQEGFEGGLGGWYADARGTTAPHSGSYYASGAYSVDYYQAVISRSGFSYTAGQSYKLRAWVRVSKTGSVWVVSELGGYIDATVPVAANTWTPVDITYTPDRTTDGIEFFYFDGVDGTEKLDVDDVQLSRYVPAVTTLTPTIQLSDGDLTLDAGRYPYAQSSVTVPLPTRDLLEQIKPGARVKLNASAKGAWEKVYTPWVEQRRNLALNPNAAPGFNGFSSNNGAVWTVTKEAVGASSHPQGILTRAKSVVVAGQATPVLLSMYNIDALNNVAPARKIGAWIYATASGYRARIGTTGAWTPLTVATWTWIVGDAPLNGYSGAYVEKITGNAGSSDIAYITGVTALAGTVDPPFTVAPGATTDTELERTVWVGTANASASALQTRELVRVDWVPTPGITADLALIEREADHESKELTLRLASDEAILDGWAPLTEDKTPRTHEANLRNLVNYVLGKAIPGAALQPGTANANLTAQWDATNLFVNPSFEVNTVGWGQGSNNTGIARTVGEVGAIEGTAALRWYTGTAGTSYLDADKISVREGYIYTVSGSFVSSGARPLRIMVRFYYDTGYVDTLGAPTTLKTAGWTRISRTFTVPKGVSQVSFHFAYDSDVGGRAVWAEAMMLTEGPVLLPFFSGATANTSSYTYAWTGTAHASTSTRTATPERLPELFTWEAGQSAWDFLQPLTAAAGLRLFCDEQRRWFLIDPAAYLVPGRFSARPGNTVEGSDTMDADDEETGITGVVVTFKWTDGDGASLTRSDFAGVPGKVKRLEFDRPYLPGVAAAHLSKVQGQNRTQDVTCGIDYSVRPGMEVQIDLPGTNAQLGTLTAARFELTNGLMSLQSAGLRDTPPGSIDLLPGTIDALPGTIDSL